MIIGIYDLPSFMYYDRQKLLNCLQILERCLINISTARIELWECNSKDGSFSVFHTEMINTHWRLKVKLNTTIPPDCKFMCTTVLFDWFVKAILKMNQNLHPCCLR